MRIRTLWFTFFLMLMLLLPPLFAQISPDDSEDVSSRADSGLASGTVADVDDGATDSTAAH